MHSTQNWFGISKRRPRKEGSRVWEQGEARMDRKIENERNTETAKGHNKRGWIVRKTQRRMQRKRMSKI